MMNEPKREWVGLTAEEREQVQVESYGKVPHHVALIAAVEAKLKEKNTAIVVPKEESLFPVQVSIEEFMMRAEQDPDLVGRPVIWTQWPKEAKK